MSDGLLPMPMQSLVCDGLIENTDLKITDVNRARKLCLAEGDSDIAYPLCVRACAFGGEEAAAVTSNTNPTRGNPRFRSVVVGNRKAQRLPPADAAAQAMSTA
jgi:hypothetical protein